MTQVISFNSSKEEVAIYFQKEFKISEEVKNKLISEDISGDILLDITAQEYKSFGIKSGSWVKIKNFLSKYEEKLKQKNEITEKITIKSNAEEVKSFLERCLNFKEETNNLDGKDLIELDEEGMNKLGLNFGQKLKLGKYIKYFKTLKVEEEPLNEDIILVADDSEVIRIFVKKIFDAEYELAFATNGDEALNIIKEHMEDNRIKAILLDLNMPVKDGFAVLDFLKENDLLSSMPVTIVSGDSSREAIDKAFTYNIVDMLSKPFNEAKIKEVVERTIESKK